MINDRARRRQTGAGPWVRICDELAGPMVESEIAKSLEKSCHGGGAAMPARAGPGRRAWL